MTTPEDVHYVGDINQPGIETEALTTIEEPTSRDTLNLIKRAVQTGVVIAELLPTNEALRYGALGLTLATVGPSPVLGAAVLGGSTLIVEGAAALATADLLSTDKSSRIIKKINEKVHQVIPEDAHMSKVTEAGVALYGGSVVVMAEKQREDPTRTAMQNRKYGIFTAGWMSGVLAAEGAAIGAGVENITSPTTVGAALIAIGGIVAATKWAKDHLKNDIVETSKPRYDLSSDEMDHIERDLVKEVKEKVTEEGIVAVWISPKHEYANLIRMHEASYFPEVAEVSEEDEENTVFLALVDTRKDVNRVVHGATIMKPAEDFLADSRTTQSTGFYTIDELIERNNFTIEEFDDYYTQRGIDIGKSIAVETNFRIGERATDYQGLGTADLTYLALFQLVKNSDAKVGHAVVFATMNPKQIRSFERVGLKFEPLMGKKRFNSQEAELGVDFLPVSIPYDEKANALLGAMPVTIPAVYLDA